ncbi:vWA domain-containing protein [Hydrogenimonas thermophila]|uniref:Ca-activated chloride channel family protein n=1 Tax=Hydrogenimonas thermophila TaxID=223786 RepID=A0A1I5SXZ5_9BACT|nr:VWA domain-containing protein [Hydrogenimonas thermophila]SFP75620.1 Ca-activated chloride channel family protein [Hydrogenimonas thermophila]
MRFLYPEFLYLMLIPAGVLIYLISTNRDALERIFEPKTLEKLRISGDGLGRTGHNVLIFIAFFFMTLALAQPVIEKGEERVKVSGTDIVIAIDLSLSMQARDFFPNRLAFAKQKIKEILPQLPAGRVAIVGFTSASFIVAPLTTDKDALNFLLNRLKSETITAKGTDLLAAIKGSIKLLKNSSSKTLLLVTDGGDVENIDPIVSLLKKESVRPIIWMVATQKGAPLPMEKFSKKSKDLVLSKANRRLKRVADECDGLYVEATISQRDEKKIEEYLKQLSNVSKTYEKVVNKRIQLFYYPLALALLILPFGIYSIGRGSQSALLLFFISLSYQKVDAGILDFQLIEDGKKTYKEGDYKRSVKAFEELSIHNPRSEVWFNLGNSYYKSGRYKMALNAYSKVVTKDLKIEKAKLYNMANCYVKLGELEKAALFYQKVLKLGNDEDAKANLALVLKALKEKKKQDKKSSYKGKNKEKNRNKSSSEASVSKENSSKPGALKNRVKKRELSQAEEKKWMQLIENQPLKSKLYPLTPPESKENVNPW